MSAINAFWDLLPGTANGLNIMQAMLDASQYWQPDAYHTACLDTDVFLGKASLFNLTASEKDTIHSDKQSSVICVANARLDNRKLLLTRLGLSEDCPRSQYTDGELILRSYQNWGEACVNYLLGDFVFIIWDPKEEKLFCARDHIGVKVLFYAYTDQAVIVSNEHKSLLTTGLIDPVLDEDWVARHIIHYGVDHFGSSIKGIEVLPPAHCLTLRRGGVCLHRYWSLKPLDLSGYLTDASLLTELKARFERAVERRVETVYPLAAELSEGLDSSGIAGCAAQLDRSRVLHTLSYECIEETTETTGVWGETYKDIYAMLKMHPNMHPVWQSPFNQYDFKREQVCRLQVHYGSASGLRVGRSLIRMKLASTNGARVLLSGWGGDHCVTSYGNHYESELFKRLAFLKLHRLMLKKYQRGRGVKPLKGWCLMLAKHCFPPLYRYFFVHRNGLGGHMRNGLKASYLRLGVGNSDRYYRIAKRYIETYDCQSVRERDRRELQSQGLVNRLTESELNSRLFRLEYRFPMLDVELLEFAFSVPGYLKVKNGVERYMFRKILEGVTTERIRWRRKVDVSHPQLDREQELLELQKQLYSTLDRRQMQRFIEFEKLDSLIKQKQPGITRKLVFLSSIQSALQSGQLRLASDCNGG